MSNRSGFQLSLAAISLAMMAAGCERVPAGQGEEVAAQKPPVPAGVTPVPTSPSPSLAELSIAQIAGGWRVVRSSAGKSATLGAIAEIYPETASWSYRPKGASGLGQLCREPVTQPITSPSVVSPAGKIGKVGDAPSMTHEIMCAGGGEFGPPEGADVQLRADGRLALRWLDDEYLLLEKLDRPAPEQGLTRQDYAADEAR